VPAKCNSVSDKIIVPTKFKTTSSSTAAQTAETQTEKQNCTLKQQRNTNETPSPRITKKGRRHSVGPPEQRRKPAAPEKSVDEGIPLNNRFSQLPPNPGDSMEVEEKAGPSRPRSSPRKKIDVT